MQAASTTAGTVEKVSVRRGHILLWEWSDGSWKWECVDHGYATVAVGSSESRAYAITDANIALIRADAVPF